jgi:hypothetical protein
VKIPVSEFSDLVLSEKPLKIGKAPGGKSGALLATYEGGVKAILKVSKEKLPSGHRKQRGIPAAVHPMHEVAFYNAAKLFDFESIVPETVLTTKAIDGAITSAQKFVPAHHINELQPALKNVNDPKWGAILAETCMVVPKKFWKHLLALDILGGVRDRHANNVGFLIKSEDDRPVYRLIAWDNAVSFGKTFDRYHNVFHKFIFRRSVDLGDTWHALDGLSRADLRDALGEYLQPDEIENAYLRVRFFVDFPYRLPWKVCSKGDDSPHGFPSYKSYFDPVEERPLHLLRVPA